MLERLEPLVCQASSPGKNLASAQPLFEHERIVRCNTNNWLHISNPSPKKTQLVCSLIRRQCAKVAGQCRAVTGVTESGEGCTLVLIKYVGPDKGWRCDG